MVSLALTQSAARFACFPVIMASSASRAILQIMEQHHLVSVLVFLVLTSSLTGFASEIMRGFEDQVVHPGSDVTVRCEATGVPLTPISWFLDDHLLTESTKTRIANQELNNGRWISELSIKQISVPEGGLYTCANNNNSRSKGYSARINVIGKIGIRKLTDQTVVSGENFTISCPYYGHPIQEIIWKKGEMSLPRHVRQTVKNSILTIKHVKKEADGGQYECVVNDESGYQVQEHFNLKVMIPVKIMPFSFQEDLLREGMRARLQCVVSEGDSPINIRWTKDDKQIPDDLGIIIRSLDEFSSILTINHVGPRHNGRYVCSATNPVSKTSHVARLNVNAPPKIIPFAFLDDQFYKGMRAHISCAVSQGDQPLSFQWFKDGQPLPVTLDVISRQYDPFTSSLSIESVTSKHSGNYTCTITNDAATVNHTAQLLVHVSPKIIPFSFQDKYLSEGAQARVLCGLTHGDSPIRFHWLKDNKPIPGTGSVLIREVDIFSSILSIGLVSGEHSGNYTCVVDNSAGSANYTAELVVNVPPKIVPFTFQDNDLLEGMLVRVSCVVSRGDLPLSITWLKDGQPIPADLAVTTRDFDEYSSVLSIDPVSAKHNGNFTCVARNAADSASFTADLLVQELPKWIVKPKDASVHMGVPLLIQCVASGFPKPTTTWLKVKGIKSTGDREQIVSGPDFELLANGSLYIPSVKMYHQGYYFCLAENNIGVASEMVQLAIRAPPEILQKSPNHSVKQGNTLVLKCEGLGDKPMTVFWNVHGQNLSTVEHNRYQIMKYEENEKTISELKIQVTETKDSTIFKCLVSNQYGKDEAYFNVTIQDHPGPPMNLKTLEVTNRTVVVAWKSSFDGNSPIIKYITQIKAVDDRWGSSTRNQTTPGQILQSAITGLKPSVKYHVRVFAENDIGISQPSSVIEVAMAEEAPSSPPQGVVVTATESNALKVSWKPPVKEHWNGVVRGYYVGHKTAGSSDSYQFRLLEVPEDYVDSLSLPITGLQKFTKYGVVVQAFNDGGKGPMSKEVLAITSESVPTKSPSDVRCSVLTSQTVHVTWHQPPVNSIHGILQGYKITYRPVTDRQDGRINAKTVNSTKLTISGLEKFTNYSLQVLAFTRRGDGKKSNPTFCRTLEDIPDMPADIKAFSASMDSAVVVWKAPKNSNGVIIKYNVYSVRSGKKEAPKKYSTHGNVTYYEIHGLNLKEQYNLWVTASTSVGEGQQSQIVKTSNQETIPARIAAFDSEFRINQGEDFQLHCRAVGKPNPEHSWTSDGNTLMENDRVQLLTDGSIIIKETQESDNGNYTCRVYNVHGEDQVTYSIIVQAVPGIMYVEISLISTTSIDIQWKSGSNGGSTVIGYKLSFKPEQGEWETIDLEPLMTSYRLDGLHCGTKYLLAMLAYNKLGEGKPSPTIATSTKGGVPVPPLKEALVEESSTFVSLNLNSWIVDKCPVKYFVVEYKAFSSSQWEIFSDDIQPEKRKIVITDLVPATWYNLRMIAHSSAGTSVAEYTFATLTLEGGTIHPETVSDEASIRPIAFQLNLKHLIAAAALVLIVLLLAIIICICARKSPSKKRKGKRGHAMLNGAASECGSDSTYNTSYAFVPAKGTIGGDPRRFHGSLGRNGDLSPYATAQLSDHYPAHQLAALDLRSCVVGIGNHMPPGTTIPFYPQGGVRPASGISGNVVGPMPSDMIKIRGHLQQFPTAPPMSVSYGGDPTQGINRERDVLVAPPLPPPNQNGIRRCSADEMETTFVFPTAPQVVTPKASNQGEQKYDAPWEGSRGAAVMKNS